MLNKIKNYALAVVSGVAATFAILWYFAKRELRYYYQQSPKNRKRIAELDALIAQKRKEIGL